MFTDHTNTTVEFTSGYYYYNVEFYNSAFSYSSNGNIYGTEFTTSTNTWYHLSTVMTGTGNMVGNKMYINGENYPLSWILNSANGNALFQNYIVLGGWMVNTDFMLHGYESQIYYFDREL